MIIVTDEDALRENDVAFDFDAVGAGEEGETPYLALTCDRYLAIIFVALKRHIVFVLRVDIIALKREIAKCVDVASFSDGCVVADRYVLGNSGFGMAAGS